MHKNDIKKFQELLSSIPGPIARWLLSRLTMSWSLEKFRAFVEMGLAKAEMDNKDQELYGGVENKGLRSINHEDKKEVKKLADNYAEKSRAFERIKKRQS